MQISELANDLVGYFEDVREDFTRPVEILYDDKPQGDLGSTAMYNMVDDTVTLYTNGRHPKDILRSLAHELVHHCQNCRGEFDELGEIEEDYIQKNPHLREMEREAYLGNMEFRDWEKKVRSSDSAKSLNEAILELICDDTKEKLLG